MPEGVALPADSVTLAAVLGSAAAAPTTPTNKPGTATEAINNLRKKRPTDRPSSFIGRPFADRTFKNLWDAMSSGTRRHLSRGPPEGQRKGSVLYLIFVLSQLSCESSDDNEPALPAGQSAVGINCNTKGQTKWLLFVLQNILLPALEEQAVLGEGFICASTWTGVVLPFHGVG